MQMTGSIKKQPAGAAGTDEQFMHEVAAMVHATTTADGRLEVAEAIAATTQLVSVDPTTLPFTTRPDDLFDRTFNDEQVGIDDENLMRAFKAHLERRLPQIAAVIEAKVPTNPAMGIELVANFVRAALRNV
jgi:hypothetical protein